MDKRERLEKTLAGEATDRIPAALWRYFPGDDLRSADLAHATVQFQETYDWDFVKVTPSRYYSVLDYGVQTQWQGEVSGERAATKRPIQRSLDWTDIRTLDPLRGELGKHLETVRLIRDALPDVPVIMTIYSPLSQAKLLGDADLMVRNMRNHADRLKTGLNAITDTTLRFIDALRRMEIDGIFYVIDQANFGVMAEAEYSEFGLPYDRKILEYLPAGWWLNVLSLPRYAPMFEFAATYPVPVIHWDMTITGPEFDKALAIFRGALCSGLSVEQHLHLGTPAIVRDAVRQAINQTYARRLILGAGDALPPGTPISNLRAVREAVESVRII